MTVLDLTDRELLIETLDELRALQARLCRIEEWLERGASRDGGEATPANIEVWSADTFPDTWSVALNGKLYQEGFSTVTDAMQTAADLRQELLR